MNWKEIDRRLLKVSFAGLEEAPPDEREHNLAQLEQWFRELRPKPSPDSSMNMFEHFENRVLYFQDYFSDQCPQPEQSLRLAHMAAQAALIRSSSNSSLKLANSALRAFGRTMRGKLEKDESKNELLRDLNGMFEGRLPGARFISWIQSQNHEGIGDASFFISDILRVRSLAYSFSREEELLKLADHDLNIALAVLVQQDRETDAVRIPLETRKMGPLHRHGARATFVFSDRYLEEGHTDILLAQYISLLKQKALVDLELGLLYLHSKKRSKAQALFAESASGWEEIVKQMYLSDRLVSFGSLFSSLLSAIVRNLDRGKDLLADHALFDFYTGFNWESEFKKEAMAVLKYLPLFDYTQPMIIWLKTNLKVILSGVGMTGSTWKGVLQTLLDQDWVGIDIQDVIGDLMKQFKKGDPAAQDEYINAWLEVIHERGADTAHITVDAESPAKRVLLTLLAAVKDDPSIFAKGESLKTVRILRPWLEELDPSCKGILEDIIQLAGKDETRRVGPDY